MSYFLRDSRSVAHTRRTRYAGAIASVALYVGGCTTVYGTRAAATPAAPSPDATDRAPATGCERLVPQTARAFPGDEAGGAAWAPPRVVGPARTLILESLALSGGTVVRWPTDHMPIRVWIASWTGVRHRDVASGAEFGFEVARAVRDWNAATMNVRLAVVHDSAAADVWIRWARRVQPGSDGGLHDADGRSAVFHDARTGAITDAAITLSELDGRGARLTPRDVHVVAVHEIGHVLGLAHAITGRQGDGHALSVMGARIATEEVADVDRLALHVWYTLPVGASCAEQVPAPLDATAPP